MITKKVNNRITDVFIGEGWDKWIRIDTKSKRILASNLPSPYKYQQALLQLLATPH